MPLRAGRTAAIAAACLASAILAGPASALAVPSNTPDAGWPQVNGTIRAMALAGNRLYIAGSFTQVGGQTHKNVAVLNATTGAVDASFNAATDGEVLALAVSGSQLYLGGEFLTVDGTGRPRLAAVDATTGALTAAFDPKVGMGVVRSLAVSSTRLYAGGYGIYVTGSPPAPNPRQLWAFDPASGAVDAGFGGQPDSSVRALLLSGTRLFAGGDFTMIGATARRGVAALDPATGAADTGFDAKADGDVYALATAGARLFLGGGFAHVGGVQRVAMGALNSATGAADAHWVADADHIIDALATSESRLYAGGVKGSFGTLGSRTVVAARLINGELSTDFGPDFGAGPPQVYALVLSSSRAYAGGSFTLAGGQQGIAAFPLLPPINASAPFVTGNPVKGKRLTCRPGVWWNDPTGFAFQWTRDGRTIAGATSVTRKITRADVGHRLRCRVTAANPVGTGAASSAAVKPALPDTTPPKMRIVNRDLVMSSHGSVKVRLACPKSETRCTGTVVLRAADLKGKPILGVRGFGFRGGRIRGVKVRLDQRAQKLVRSSSWVRARVRLNARDSAGNSARINRTLTLVAV